MDTVKVLTVVFFSILQLPAHAGNFIPCADDPGRLSARQAELQKILSDDQQDRKMFERPEKIETASILKMAEHDVARRKRVGEIFGEGCFKGASDYAAAALVFQHGDIPDHFFQAFLWAKRAVELGDSSQKSLVALAIDRYLVKTGRKQLFGSEAHPSNPKDLKSCYCMAKIEPSFPDFIRKQYIGRGKQEALQFTLKDHLNVGRNCPNTECDEKLSPSPQGSVPGFW